MFGEKRERKVSACIGKLAFVVFLWLTPIAIQASAKTGADFQKAIQLFESKQYLKAIPLLEEVAEKGNKAAMYRLAYIYENGLGVPQDFKKAAHWYKEAAKTYAYTVEKTKKGHNVYAKKFAERLKAQFTESSVRAAGMAAIAKVDTNTPETKSLLNDMAEGRFFGLTPYKANYIMPIGYANRKYRRQPSAYKNYTIADAINPIPGFSRESEYGEYDQQAEVEFQFSLKKNLTYNLFGFNEYITAAYTQRCFWQLYSESGPFRETNYMPELYVAVPTSQSFDEKTGMKVTKWGFIHQSNGQEGFRSRSWNRLYVEGFFQWNNLFLKPRIWYRLPEEDKSDDYYRGYVDRNHNGKPDTGDQLIDPNSESGKDDNPDILDYMGYGDLTLSYLWGKHQFGGLFRYNFGKGGHDRGAVQLDWSYPFFNSKTTFWYFKFFNGYGESLIDYNRNVTKTSFGFAFSRGLFQ
ncbi:phospholipase A [Hydrogenimonas urashimensis]|uniref:phospholipase A n=1 Tax=Hydrogenimonas urashimensis TaxID=2740515 RepID=UPI001914DD99|nr:phospholipase A [Hydrogenimonas urashimensis]